MANRTLIIVLGGLAALALGAVVAIFTVYDGDKAIAIGALVTVVGLFIPQLLSLKQSADNAVAIEKVDVKVDDNTAVTQSAKNDLVEVKAQQADTHDLVDGQAHEWRAAVEKIAELQALVAGLMGNAAGRDEARQIAIDLIAAQATPATHVEPGSDGKIVITAPASVDIVAPASGAN